MKLRHFRLRTRRQIKELEHVLLYGVRSKRPVGHGQPTGHMFAETMEAAERMFQQLPRRAHTPLILHLLRMGRSLLPPPTPWGDVSPEEAAKLDHQMRHGPCFECGATTADEAGTKCHCAGDKDHCHGCDLWPDS